MTQTTPRLVEKREVAGAYNIVVGNHYSRRGIGEIVYTLNSYFANHLGAGGRVSFSFVPGTINIIIDEFSVPGTVDYIAKLKRAHPNTKIVLVATEFITPIKLFGIRLDQTFNYFGPWEDRRYGLSMVAHRLGLKNSAPYMQRRYFGFVDALQVADFVLTVHPAISAMLKPFAAKMIHWAAAPVNLYPEIDPERVARDPRLKRLAAGFFMSGTLTPFRKQITEQLIRCGRRANVQGPIYQHVPFDQSDEFNLRDGSISFDFDKVVTEAEEEHIEKATSDRLYNLNPPQRANWFYSSPMRILRAILLGQIPVVTQKFDQHEIEGIARVWNPKSAHYLADFHELWHDGTIGRAAMIERHITAVREYNNLARQKNNVIDAILEKLAVRHNFS